jgi:cobyrinic acid a,c-diamide synthase
VVTPRTEPAAGDAEAPSGRAAVLPRLVVAAAASGSGKTTVATGLMAALRHRGLQVSGHKVGPDYIDPGFHSLACSRPGRNLDPRLVGEDRVPGLLLHAAATPVPADVAVIEGVMGLFDGADDPAGFASTAHVARLVQAQVLLVLDVRGQARTAAAVVAGLRGYDPAVRIGAVVVNRVGSPGHERTVRSALAELGVPVAGVIPRRAEIAAPSRHLGLVPVAERSAESSAVVRALGELVGETVDLDAVLALARTAPPLPGPAWDPVRELAAHHRHSTPVRAASVTATGPVVAVAGGPAFTFGYAETEELLAAAGARVVRFDPLSDVDLPADTSAVVIGGGFPEMYAEALGANTGLRRAVADFDGPIVAECAGLLYLGRELDGVPMVGRLPVHARMTPRLRLGYRRATAANDSVLATAGTVVTGHEFHRTSTDPQAGAVPAWRWDGAAHGFIQGRVHASYLHLHPAGNPGSMLRLVRAAAGGTKE